MSTNKKLENLCAFLSSLGYSEEQINQFVKETKPLEEKIELEEDKVKSAMEAFIMSAKFML